MSRPISAAKVAPAAPRPASVKLQDLTDVFVTFGAKDGEMDGTKFAKFTKDTGVQDGKKVTSTEVDIVFGKVKEKTARKINYAQFEQAIGLLADKRYPGKTHEEAVAAAMADICKAKGPVIKGTKAQEDEVTKRMTDVSQYTGTHKERFNEDGTGKGLAGRDQPVQTADLSQIVANK
ncbi:p25-alpha-domain-containing protein [Chytriomyces sp. MP71]|nr:p25-alpha-domain-containing protein [Chytriomyces sp. MP71]